MQQVRLSSKQTVLRLMEIRALRQACTKSFLERGRQNFIVNLVSILESYCLNLSSSFDDDLLDGSFSLQVIFAALPTISTGQRNEITSLLDLRNRIVHEDARVQISAKQETKYFALVVDLLILVDQRILESRVNKKSVKNPTHSR